MLGKPWRADLDVPGVRPAHARQGEQGREKPEISALASAAMRRSTESGYARVGIEIREADLAGGRSPPVGNLRQDAGIL